MSPTPMTREQAWETLAFWMPDFPDDWDFTVEADEHGDPREALAFLRTEMERLEGEQAKLHEVLDAVGAPRERLGGNPYSGEKVTWNLAGRIAALRDEHRATVERLEALTVAAKPGERCTRTHVDPDTQHLLDIIDRQKARAERAEAQLAQANEALRLGELDRQAAYDRGWEAALNQEYPPEVGSRRTLEQGDKDA